jgi:chromosome segregation ATPase
MTLDDAADLLETRLDDLQAEMEAGTRCVTKLRDEAAGRDGRLGTALRTAQQTGELMHRVAELERSIRQQRLLMRHLRKEVRTLRSHLFRTRPAPDPS